MRKLEERFHQEMLDTYNQAAKLGYRATYFLQVAHEHGGVGAAKMLLAKSASASGFERLWELGRLDISVEALVLKPEFMALFSDAERQVARERLAELGYRAPWDTPEYRENTEKRDWLP